MGQISINRKQKRIANFFAIVFAIGFLSIGCNTAQIEESSVRRMDTSDTSHVITVTPKTGETAESIAAEYNGDVLAFIEGKMALVSISAGASGEISQQMLSQLKLSDDTIEESKDKFLAGGKIASMSGGSSAWAGGGSSAWAGGTFSWLEQNTELWQQINLESGHSIAKELGFNTIVAVIDTGVDYNHPALTEAVIPGWDFYDNDDDPFDEGELGEDVATGHGTNVAGIIRQVAPRATILPIRVLGTDGSGSVANVATAILWAMEQGAHVINLSLGSDTPSPAVQAAINEVSNAGVFVTASTGNTGDNNVTFPAMDMQSDSRHISVTSVDNNDNKSVFATYSDVIEISAPGENVYAPAPENRLAAWSGTSMAAPMVAGALALVLGEFNGSSDPAFGDKILDEAADIYNNETNSAHSGLIGAGRLDVENFLIQF